MSLINKSYFVGELNIPNTDKEAISERLDIFITEYEEKLLRDVLGYSLKKEFLEGLGEEPIAQKWQDLLFGKEYTRLDGLLYKWRGIIHAAGGQQISISNQNILSLTVGGSGTYDPIAGSGTMTLPASFVGVEFEIERRGIGTLTEDEYSVDGSLLTLEGDDDEFHAGETIFLRKGSAIVITSEDTQLKSFIANYVYWHWIKDQHTQTVGLGEVKAKAENASPAIPTYKLVRAWNDMAEWITDLIDYLDKYRDDYPEWEDQNRYQLFRKFGRINEFGI